MPFKKRPVEVNPGPVADARPARAPVCFGTSSPALVLLVGLASGALLTLLVQRAATTSAARARRVGAGAAPSDRSSRQAAPWAGLVDFTPVLLVPPPENLAGLSCSPTPPTWTLASATPEALEQLFEGVGLPAAQRAEARGFTSCVKGEGCVLRPPLAFVDGLTGVVRGQIYRRLAADSRNYFQYYAFRLHADEIDPWFERSGMPPAVQSRMRALLYEQGDGLWSFADHPSMCGALRPGEEQRTYLRALHSERSLTGRVRIPAGVDLRAVERYWSAGGQSPEGVKARLRALAESPDTSPDTSIDLAELLPPLARARLNTYPTPADPPGLNCHWAAMNFFSEHPDPALADWASALAILERDYERVPIEHARYGDILAITRGDPEELLHAAVYIHDGVYFSKNGRGLVRAFALSRYDRIRELYPPVDGIHESLYRRRSAAIMD